MQAQQGRATLSELDVSFYEQASLNGVCQNTDCREENCHKYDRERWGHRLIIVHNNNIMEVIWFEVKLTVFLTILIKAIK